MSGLLAIVSPQIEQTWDWCRRHDIPDGSWIWVGAPDSIPDEPVTRFVLAWRPALPASLSGWRTEQRRWERSVYPLIRKRLIARGAVDITRLIYL